VNRRDFAAASLEIPSRAWGRATFPCERRTRCLYHRFAAVRLGVVLPGMVKRRSAQKGGDTDQRPERCHGCVLRRIAFARQGARPGHDRLTMRAHRFLWDIARHSVLRSAIAPILAHRGDARITVSGPRVQQGHRGSGSQAGHRRDSG